MYGFHLFARDESFDLLAGTLPGTFHFLLGDQLERAQAVLSHRTAEQVAYAIESLDWMLREGSHHLFKESIAVLKGKDHHFINRVKALRAFMPHFELSGQTRLPDATWADYFAALTLAYVTEALYVDQHPAEPHGPQTGVDCGSALEAMDAACFAEQLVSLVKANTPQPLNAAESGRLGGKMRMSKFNGLKDKVFDLYERKYHTCPSNREAARRILLELTDEDLSVLSTDNPQERIQKWIGAYKKAKDDTLKQRFT